MAKPGSLQIWLVRLIPIVVIGVLRPALAAAEGATALIVDDGHIRVRERFVQVCVALRREVRTRGQEHKAIMARAIRYGRHALNIARTSASGQS